MSKQTQNRISDERLAEYAAWREWDDPDGLQHDATLMAHELTALRASHKRLVEAMEGANRLFKEPSPFYIKKLGSPITNGDQAVIDKVFIDIEAALAEARKLEGE